MTTKKTKHLIALMSFIVIIIPLSSYADDTAVYDISTNVKPNVLIIFDNSISMGSIVPYVDSATYSGSYDPDTNYQRTCTRWRYGICREWSWLVYTGTFTDTNLDGKHDPDPNNIQRGNRRNYDSNPPGDKIDAAKTVAKKIIDDTYQYVRLGIMLLHGDVGWDTLPGYHKDNTVLAPDNGGSQIKQWDNDGGATDKDILKGYVNNFAAVGATPLAIRLINAAQYFKHEDSTTFGNFGATGGFTDPITSASWCRKNYVVIVTDGRPTYEGDTTSSSDQNEGQFDYIESFLPSRTDTEVETPPPGANKHGRHNYDYDATNNPDDWDPWGASTGNRYTVYDSGGGSDYLDDVAKYIYDTDLRPAIDGTQNITTFTIGFAVDDQLLQDTADNGHGEYYTTNSYDELEQALTNVMATIIDRAQTFTAPVVPVQRTTSGDKMYISLFTPRSTENFWPGYLVKLKIGSNGELMGFSSGYGSGAEVQVTDSYGVLNEDLLKSDRTPYPYWDTQYKLKTRSTARNIYTYLGNSDLNNTANAFVTTNTAITASMLNTPSKQASADPGTTARDDLINYIRGADAFNEDGDTNYTEKREFIMGDILHSRPLIIDYDASDPVNPQRVIYVGTNDGMLHAFDDTDGSEKWAFIPPDLLPQLKNIVEGSDHQYYVDGSPQAYTLDGNYDGDLLDVGTDKVIIVFGERRGGTSYTALDVTDPDDPQYLWRIDKANPTIAGIPNPTTVISEMGQSWSEPQIGKVKAGTVGSETPTIVAIFGGGYTEDNSAGRALYLINALNGSLVKGFTSSDHSNLTISIPSTVLAADTNFDGYVNRVYVGDLAGQMWRFGNQTGTEDGNVNNWTPRRLFDSSLTGAKVFYPPDMVLEPGYAYLYFGTGNREDPMSMSGTNRLYALKDKNVIGSYTTLVDSDLVDVTSDQLQDPGVSETIKQGIRDQLATGNGWYITLSSAEKVLAPTTVFSGMVIFTTFTPVDTVANPCSYGGDARLYIVDYLTAVSVIDFDLDGDVDISDRSEQIGQGIPTEAVITISADGSVMAYVGAGGGIFSMELPSSSGNFNVESWREVF
jgi:type IV pilus assembly protein PilY1